MRIADETLDYWAGRYLDAELSGMLSFQRFLQLTRARREQLLHAAELRHQASAEIQQLEHITPLHGDRLLEPMHVRGEPFRYRRPWFFRPRRWWGRRSAS